MSWAGISSNQCVSCNNLQDAVNNGVFTLKNTIPSSTKQITKTEAAYYVNINQSYAPYAAKSSNQLVVKSNLQACTTLGYSYTLYYNYNDSLPNVIGFSSGALACGATNSFTVYSSSSTIGVGSALYFDSCGYDIIRASAYNSTGNQYFKIGGSYVTFEDWDATTTGYIIRTITACVTSYGWLFNGGGAGFSTSAAALATFTGGPYHYANINGMVSGVTQFYTDSGLVYPFNGGNLWYCVQLNGSGTRYAAYINSSGLVTTYTT